MLRALNASVQFSSVAQSCPTLCDPMNRSTPGLPVHHQLTEFTQTHVHQVSDAIQPSHPLSSPSPLNAYCFPKEFCQILKQEEKGTAEDETAGWHHWLDGRESGWAPGVGDGHGGLACRNSWGRKESDTTEQLKWTRHNRETLTSLKGIVVGHGKPELEIALYVCLEWRGKYKVKCGRKSCPYFTQIWICSL